VAEAGRAEDVQAPAVEAATPAAGVAGAMPLGTAALTRGPLDARRILALQRAIGNRGVGRMLARQPRPGMPGHSEYDSSGGVPANEHRTPEGAAAAAADWWKKPDWPYAAIVRKPELARDAIAYLIREEGLAAAETSLEELRDETANMKADRSDMSGVTDQSTQLEEQIRAREQALPVLEEALAEWKEFMDLFEARGLLLVTKLLQISEQQVLKEQQRYGLSKQSEVTERYSYIEKSKVYGMKTTYSMADNEQSKSLSAAANELAGKVEAIRAAHDEMQTYIGFVPDDYGEMVLGVTDEKGHAAASKKYEAANDAYDLMRYEKEAEFPVLASVTPIDKQGGGQAIASTLKRLRDVGQGASSASARELLAEDVDKKLENIRRVREGVADGDVTIWTMPQICDLVKRELGVEPGSAKDRIVDDRVKHASSARVARDIILGVVAIALAIAAAPLTGGASLGFGAAVVAGTAAVAGAGLSTYLAVEHIQEYQLEKAKGGTHFDRAKALSQEDPSLFWLAVDIIGAGLDAKVAITAFKVVGKAARAAIMASRFAEGAEQVAKAQKEMQALEKLAQGELKEAGAGAKVRVHAEAQAVREGAEAKGLAGKWTSELDKDAKDLLKNNEGMAKTWREMDPEVRELLTRCGSLCIPPTASAEQAKRLRKVLDKIPPRHRQGLKEFLYAERANLDTAIKDLEELFSKDLGPAIDEAMTALEHGHLPQEGELVSAGRRGTGPADVPDVVGKRGPLEAGQRVPLDLLKRTQQVLGKTIAEAPEAVQKAWREAREAVLKNRGPLTAENYGELYKDAQKRFWANVRDDEAAKNWFKDRGFGFDTTKSGAPSVELPQTRKTRKEFSIELDHKAPKGTADNWSKALDADNLQFLTGWDNWLLNEIERLVPELGR
jgi:hypothetical protein